MMGSYGPLFSLGSGGKGSGSPRAGVYAGERTALRLWGMMPGKVRERPREDEAALCSRMCSWKSALFGSAIWHRWQKQDAASSFWDDWLLLPRSELWRLLLLLTMDAPGVLNLEWVRSWPFSAARLLNCLKHTEHLKVPCW